MPPGREAELTLDPVLQRAAMGGRKNIGCPKPGFSVMRRQDRPFTRLLPAA